jgi:iron complex transport system substrate-binding protein
MVPRGARRPLRLVAAALALLGSTAAAPPRAGDARPRRIVSLNLCADQLLLVLADRDQIAGLTDVAADTRLSAEAARTRGLRILGHSAEEVLAIGPDLLVGMPTSSSAVMPALAGRHYRTLDLTSGESYDAILTNIRMVAAAVGHPERGEAVIARMNAALARLGRPGHGRTAAYYQRRGYLTGTGTLVDDLMTRLGLVNLAARLHKPVLAQLSLEELIAARPDYLIVESASDRVTDQGTEMLHHPALAPIPRLHVPQAWTVCGGPRYVDAAQSLARQLEGARVPNGRLNAR